MNEKNRQVDFNVLMDAYLDCEISVEEKETLEDWLEQSPEHCDLLARRTREHAILRDTLLAQQQGVTFAGGKLGAVAQIQGFFSHLTPFSLVVSAILTPIFVFMILLILFSSTSKVSEDSGECVARITEMRNVQWATEQPDALKIGDDLPAGTIIHLKTGRVNLTFERGASVLLKGPVEFVVDTENGGTLDSGELMAHVPSAAIGFTVETPRVSVVDLGTEFGVRVNREGRKVDVDVQVFVGSVELSTKGSLVSRRKLVAGEMVQVLDDSEMVRNEGRLFEFDHAASDTKTLIAEDFSRSNGPRNTPWVTWTTSDSAGLEAYQRAQHRVHGMPETYGGSLGVAAGTPIPGALEVLSEDSDSTVTARVQLPHDVEITSGVLSFWAGQRLSGDLGGFEHQLEITNVSDNRVVLPRTSVGNFENGQWAPNSFKLNFEEADSGDVLEIRFHERAGGNDRGMQLVDVRLVVNTTDAERNAEENNK